MGKLEVIKTSHPHIVRVEGTCGGRPIIKGTRTPVRSVAGYYKLGMSIDELLTALPHLKLNQIFDALSYYFDYQQEIDKDLEEDSEENLMKKLNV